MEKDKDKNFILRNYIPSDIVGILHVFRSSVTELCAQDYSPSQLKAWTDCADGDRWNAQFLSRHTTVAIADDTVVGFCDVEYNGHIDRLYIAPGYTHTGIGKALIKDAESALNTDKISVEASITAKLFFEKLGYVAIKKQSVIRNGEKLINYKMVKNR